MHGKGEGERLTFGQGEGAWFTRPSFFFLRSRGKVRWGGGSKHYLSGTRIQIGAGFSPLYSCPLAPFSPSNVSFFFSVRRLLQTRGLFQKKSGVLERGSGPSVGFIVPGPKSFSVISCPLSYFLWWCRVVGWSRKQSEEG